MKAKSLEQLVSEYRLADNLWRFVVGRGSQMKGHSMAELDIRNRYGLSVLEVRRETTKQG